MKDFHNLMSYNEVSPTLLADILSVPNATIEKWAQSGRIQALPNGHYALSDLTAFPQIKHMLNSQWEAELKVKPARKYQSIELFAGAGGLAIGLEKAGFDAVALNEIDTAACNTLRHNRPQWHVLQGDIKDVDFTEFQNIDFLSGGFPCQAFSYAGNKLGFEDTRGTLFLNLPERLKPYSQKYF